MAINSFNTEIAKRYGVQSAVILNTIKCECCMVADDEIMEKEL